MLNGLVFVLTLHTETVGRDSPSLKIQSNRIVSRYDRGGLRDREFLPFNSFPVHSALLRPVRFPINEE